MKDTVAPALAAANLPVMPRALLVLLLSGCTAAAAPERGGDAAPGAAKIRVGRTYTAATTLTFTNVRVSIEETLLDLLPWRSRRRLVLVSPAGVRKTIPLSDLTNGGGGISLYALEGDTYVLLGESDCIELDAVWLRTRSCAARADPENPGPLDQRCAARRTVLRGREGERWPLYLGRFDWMNGYDPPDGRFGLAFRYLTAESTIEGYPDCR